MRLAGLCNGSTADSDSVCEGSNPSPAAKQKTRSFWSGSFVYRRIRTLTHFNPVRMNDAQHRSNPSPAANKTDLKSFDFGSVFCFSLYFLSRNVSCAFFRRLRLQPVFCACNPSEWDKKVGQKCVLGGAYQNVFSRELAFISSWCYNDNIVRGCWV